MSVLLFGSAFNPFHNGHKAMIDAAQKTIPNISSIIFIPTHMPPHKPQPEIETQHRLEMLTLIKTTLFDSQRIIIDDFELRNDSISYTINTVKQLKNKYNAPFYFLIGSDSYFQLHTWKNISELMTEVTFIIINRSEQRSIDTIKTYHQTYLSQIPLEINPAQAKLNQLNFILCDPVPTSSSDIRLKIKKKQDISALVPKSISNYIDEKRLYQ